MPSPGPGRPLPSSSSRTWRSVLAVAAGGVLLAACTSGPSAPVATVGDIEISREQLEGWVQAAMQENPGLDAATLSAQNLTGVIALHVVDGILAELGLVVGPEFIAEVRSDIEEEVGGVLDLAVTLVEIGLSEDFFLDVFLPTQAGVRTLRLTLGEEGAREALMRAFQSARVSVDPDFGVWDPVAGNVRPN